MSRALPLTILLAFALAATPGCFVRHRAVNTPATRQPTPMVAATKDQLIQRLHEISDPLHSFVMRADLSPSVLDPSKGVATDYAAVSAYILFQKPDDMRILGKDPAIGSTIFDMVSTGGQFRMSIPPRNRFVIGSNNEPGTSSNKLENLRPSALLTSLVINPPESKPGISLLETDIERALYILLIVRRDGDEVTLDRQIYFDGHTLQITRQKTFDPGGSIVGDTRYSDWKSYDGIPFPSGIDIQRPKDNYEVQLAVVSMMMNSPDVTPAKFVLEQPSDAQVQILK
jgi:hypothetical protein